MRETPEWLDDVAISLQVQKRDEKDDGDRISFEQLMAEVGVTWDQLKDDDSNTDSRGDG